MSLPIVVNTFLTDENINGDAIELARKIWDVRIVRPVDVGLMRTADMLLFEYAIREGYVLVTGNTRHFAPLVKRWIAEGNTHPGIVYITKKHRDNSHLIAQMLALYAAEPMTIRTEWI
jgi:hypothetical protein